MTIEVRISTTGEKVRLFMASMAEVKLVVAMTGLWLMHAKRPRGEA